MKFQIKKRFSDEIFKELKNPQITFLNKRAGDETDVETIYPITHITIE